VTGMLAEWHDYRAGADGPQHVRRAHALGARRGSRGVGRDYFTVRNAGGRTFTLYYDRGPQEIGDHAGNGSCSGKTWIRRDAKPRTAGSDLVGE